MAKDPAFLFYPGDWLGGTMTFSRSHKGAYMDLLMVQFNNGHMSLQDIETVLGSDFQIMWESKLKAKFQQDPNGLYYNEKLENEVNKRKNFTDSRKKNLNNKPSHKEAHTGSRMENENGNRNENKDKKENKKKDRQPNFEIIEHPYLEKIKSDYPILLKMKEPLTQAQAEKLEIDVGDSLVYEKMEAMANRLNLLKNYSSVNLTIRSWSKLNTNNGKSTTPNPKEPKFGRIPKSDIERFMQSEIPIIFKRNPDIRGDHG